MFITVSLCKLCKERSTCGAKQAIGVMRGREEREEREERQPVLPE